MATTITNVTELQAMENDLDGDYVLGNNIDASATSGWNGGLGFDPIGDGSHTDDHFPFADDSAGGSWTIYPSDGEYFSKVDEEVVDDDATYIQATADNSWVLIVSGTVLVPDEATDITVGILCTYRNATYGNPSIVQGYLDSGGVKYLIGDPLSWPSTNWRAKNWATTINPNTGLAWTPLEVNSLSTYGMWVHDASPNVRITRLVVRVSYYLKFAGTFDGAEYTISDLYINRPTENYAGLFGYTSTTVTIQDVTLEDVDVTGNDDVGALVGVTGGGTCTIQGCSSSGAVTGGQNVGGLAGFVSGLVSDTVKDCNSSCVVSGERQVGGLIGYTSSKTVTRCHATGSVTADMGAVEGYCRAGGLVGYGKQGTISKCYAKGNVSATNSSNYVTLAGGLVGEANSDIENSYARGNATAVNSSYTAQEYAAGFAAWLRASRTIDRCYSTGTPIGNTKKGFCADNDGTITNCFWDTTTSGTETSDGGTGYATATMLLFATFSTWNIGNAAAQRNDGYPFLSWEIDESDTIWKIFGEGVYSFDFPDLMDNKGRHPKNARLRAYRTDVYGEPYIIEEQYTDHNGTATFSKLPIGIGAVFQAVWGGKSGTGNEEWFFLRVNDIEDGGTGAGTAAGALSNLGLGTEDSPQFTAINLGHASDTTVARVSAGTMSVENKPLIRMAAQTIAASDSYIKTQADLVCDGTDD